MRTVGVVMLERCVSRPHARPRIRQAKGDAWMQEALNRAKQLYKKGKYDLARQILSSNVNTAAWAAYSELAENRDEAYALYDLRADLFVKEGMFHEARNDALIMVSRQPKNPRGYLRLGQVCQFLGLTKEAVKVYQKALARINSDNESYQMLSSLLKRASKKLREQESGRCDPLGVLPREILCEIFRQLPLENLVQL